MHKLLKLQLKLKIFQNINTNIQNIDKNYNSISMI